ncbi:alpha/beta fold hydrolase [Leptospira idonii]|uniref:Alpha/beta hydrolase n=1 Tax=Leptospira idonii TaxID=1193500 RepID=A0A4R9M1A0_9LEPT|nr:alpha/beta hydrolase [Leptospira idonii]TGN19467.1 alpha/beta hydrolase [Leptospira idonii]
MSPSLQDHINSGKYAEVEGIRFFYKESGKGTEIIVLLHGFLTTSYNYRKLFPFLEGKYKVIAPDFLGIGLSDRPSSPLSHRMQAYYLYRFLDQIASEKKVHIVAHDYALPILAFLLKEHPEVVKSLTILNGFLNLPKFRFYLPVNLLRIPLFGALLSFLFRPPLLRFIYQAFLTKKDFVFDAQWEKDQFELLFTGKNRKNSLEFLKNVDRSSHALRDVEDGVKSLVGLRQIIIGDFDFRISPAQTEFIKETLRTSALISLPSKHLPMEECPEELAEKIDYFIGSFAKKKTKTFHFSRSKSNSEEE